MNCQRCGHAMIPTKETETEKFGDVVVIMTVVYNNECPECGVYMRVTVPTTTPVFIERRR